MAKYEIMREVYTRYDEGGLKISTFNAEDDKDALMKVCEHCLYGLEEDDDGNVVDYSKEQLINKIDAESGDGADYIISIKNLDSGEVLYEGGELNSDEEEDW